MDLKKGDLVMVAEGEFAKLRCLVKIQQKPGKPIGMLNNGLEITLNHPVRINGKWIQPMEVEKCSFKQNKSGVVYCFVLETTHVALVNGVECVTWGHNF